MIQRNICIFDVMSTGCQIKDQEGAHYLTLQVVGWIDVFTRQSYRDIIIESFNYCQKNKDFVIFGYVIMSNHIHLLCQSRTGRLSNTIRDFKSFTAKAILDEIMNGRESRKEWMLKYFKEAASEHERNSKYQFWTHEIAMN